MTKFVSPNTKQSATAIEDLKVKIAADIVPQLQEFLAKLHAEQVAIQSDRSVSGFCRRWGISRFLFYEKQAEMPRVMHVGGRTLISPVAEAEWVKGREAAAKVAPKRVVGKARTAQTADREREAAEKHQVKEAAE
jgi:hypothetical protein